MDTLQRLLELAGFKIILTEMSSEQARSVFQFYGVVPANDIDTLKSQFHTLAQQHHPDRGGSTESMQEINAAYETLKGSSHLVVNSEEIRRGDGQAFEDFSDIDYFARRVKSISPTPHACVAYAFNGEAFTSEINLEANIGNENVLVMIREGMLTHGGAYHTKLIGVVLKSDPRKFYIIYQSKNRGFQKMTYIPMGMGFAIEPTRDAKLLASLKSLTK